MGAEYSARTMPLGEIRRLLPTEPVSRPLCHAHSPLSVRSSTPGGGLDWPGLTSAAPRQTTEHAVKTEKDGPRLGWVRAGDPRSELVLALIKEEHGMALLLNDGALAGAEDDAAALPYPDEARAAALSPLAQLRRGRYGTPTCVVFGDADEVAPYAPAAEFARVLGEQGVRGALLSVAGARHIFDLDLAPGSDGWARHIEPAYAFLVRELETRGGGWA